MIMKKVISSLLVGMMLLSSPAAFAISTDADGDGYNSVVDCDDRDAGMYPGRVRLNSTYYSTLQEAVTAAEPLVYDVVAFCGKFFGPISVTDMGLTLFGYDAAKTKIVGSTESGVNITSSLYVNLVNFSVNDNEASVSSGLTGHGGGMNISGSQYVALVGMRLVDNYAATTGGAIDIARSTVRIMGTTIKNNDAGGDGGSIYIGGPTSSLDLIDSAITGTSSHSGIYIADDTTGIIEVDIFNTLLSDNSPYDVQMHTRDDFDWDDTVNALCTAATHTCTLY